MIIIDHIATSLISTQILNFKKFRIIILIIAVLSAILPDILVAVYQPGTIEYLSHRKYTNSLILAPIYSLIFPSIFYFILRKKNPSFPIFYFVSLFNYILHIFFDLITPYGTILFYPFSSKIYSLDFLHSFDPIFLTVSTGVILYFVILLFLKKAFKTTILVIFILIYFAYIFIMISTKYSFEDEFSNMLSKHQSNYTYSVTVPMTYWRWRGIAEITDSILVCDNNKKIQIYQKYSKSLIPKILNNDNYLVDFLEYARFPIINESNDSIFISNAIYSTQSYQLFYVIDTTNQSYKKGISGFDLADE